MLTKRQAEFLENVIYLCREGGKVHYTDVANRLGVSRWTAYDILSLLAHEGFLEVVREVKSEGNTVGRSKVFFKPTERGLTFLDEEDSLRGGDIPEWEAVRSSLWGKLTDRKAGSAREYVREMVVELGQIQNPLVFCAYLTALALLALRTVSQGVEGSAVIGSLVPLLMGPHIAVVVFTGSAFGLALQYRVLGQETQEAFKFLPQFEHHWRQLDLHSEGELKGFFEGVIAELWPKHGMVNNISLLTQ